MSAPEDRIAELTERIRGNAPRPTRPTTWYPMVNADVTFLQERLAAHGFYSTEKGDPPGVFDVMTETAVRAFQAAKGVRPDAVVNDLVWRLLEGEPHGR